MAPDDPEPVWFFTKDGERQGPASTAEMRQIALHGAMDDALVWREGLDDWQQLSNFPELLPAGQTGILHLTDLEATQSFPLLSLVPSSRSRILLTPERSRLFLLTPHQ